MHGFLQFNERLAVLKLRVRGGRIGIVTAYAPHSLRPYDERQQFYTDLGDVLDKCSVNGPTYILGDLNAKLGAQRPGEEDIIGPFWYGREVTHKVEGCNRDLFMELCTDRCFTVANTFTQAPPGKKVTYFKPGALPMGDITASSHHMIDLFLAPSTHINDVQDLGSIREATLASDHFLVTCRLRAYCQRKR